MRRIFIILGLLVFIFFFVSSNVNAVTPPVAQPPNPTAVQTPPNSNAVTSPAVQTEVTPIPAPPPPITRTDTPPPPTPTTEVTPEPTDPGPPPPPCANFVNGKCTSVNTAIGEIGTSPEAFIKSIFSLILGVSGGIALLLIIYSGYQLMAARGNPEALQAARDQLIAAIIGLVFIIFSLVILQVIGVNILKIPGFNP